MTCLSLCLFSLEISGYTKVIFTLFQCLFPNLIFLVCAAQGHPHTLSLHAIPTTRAGHGSGAGGDTSVFQSLSARLFGHCRIQECSVFTEKCFPPQRLDWNDAKARVATVRAGEVPLPTSGLLESFWPSTLSFFILSVPGCFCLCAF